MITPDNCLLPCAPGCLRCDGLNKCTLADTGYWLDPANDTAKICNYYKCATCSNWTTCITPCVTGCGKCGPNNICVLPAIYYYLDLN